MTIIDLGTGAAVDMPSVPLSIALGSFDGVHVGHRAIIARAAAIAPQGAAPAVWTFAENPFGVPCLTSPEEKLGLLAECGAKYAIVCKFDEVASLAPEEFVDQLIGFGAVALTCGFNYTFGAGKSGDADTLVRLCGERGLRCAVVDRVDVGGERVSSTRIRELIAAGAVDKAAELLGRPYSVTAPVEHGNKLGRTIGFPTINQHISADRAIPGRGVYASRCMDMPAVTNVGVRPTVTDDGEVVCETHIIGDCGDLYGKIVTVRLLRFLRDERKFKSLEALKPQLQIDSAASTAINKE